MIDLRVTIKRDSGKWFIAKCMTFDVQAQGRTPLSALNNLVKLMSIVSRPSMMPWKDRQ